MTPSDAARANLPHSLINAAVPGRLMHVNKHVMTGRLHEAAQNGHLDRVMALIPVSDPKANNSAALFVAAKHGYAQCVQALIPVSDARADESRALRAAALNGHEECVRALIPVSNPKADGSAQRGAIVGFRAGDRDQRLDAIQMAVPGCHHQSGYCVGCHRCCRNQCLDTVQMIIGCGYP